MPRTYFRHALVPRLDELHSGRGFRYIAEWDEVFLVGLHRASLLVLELLPQTGVFSRLNVPDFGGVRVLWFNCWSFFLALRCRGLLLLDSASSARMM